MVYLARTFLACVFTAHLVLAAAWWWLMPGGFPAAHPRFWVNRVLPVGVIAFVATYLWARYRRRDAVLRTLAVAMAAFWLAAAVSARVVFPVTMRWLWVVPFVGALVITWVVIRVIRSGTLRVMPLALTVIVAATLGALAPITQRGEDPTTWPLNTAFAPVAPQGSELNPNVIRLGPGLRVQPNGGVVYVECGGLHVDVEPLLTFISRSPDRCWTLLAPRRERIGPRRELLHVRPDAEWVELEYADDGASRLRVRGSDERGSVEIEASSQLPREVYSHLNSYCAIMVSGHRKLELSFSPCPDARLEVPNSDYPFGRPVRLAYLDASETFHVVEASSAEKGPFRTLASGPLKRGEPLAITLHDQGKPACRVTLEDFSAQASTARSPTAGWGVPQNSVTFMLAGAAPTSPAFISIELAGTGIGRGYDSVGHAAGVYRNRVTVHPARE
jgi:hypothetical protein